MSLSLDRQEKIIKEIKGFCAEARVTTIDPYDMDKRIDKLAIAIEALVLLYENER